MDQPGEQRLQVCDVRWGTPIAYRQDSLRSVCFLLMTLARKGKQLGWVNVWIEEFCPRAPRQGKCEFNMHKMDTGRASFSFFFVSCMSYEKEGKSLQSGSLNMYVCIYWSGRDKVPKKDHIGAKIE